MSFDLKEIITCFSECGKNISVHRHRQMWNPYETSAACDKNNAMMFCMKSFIYIIFRFVNSQIINLNELFHTCACVDGLGTRRAPPLMIDAALPSQPGHFLKNVFVSQIIKYFSTKKKQGRLWDGGWGRIIILTLSGPWIFVLCNCYAIDFAPLKSDVDEEILYVSKKRSTWHPWNGWYYCRHVASCAKNLWFGASN